MKNVDNAARIEADSVEEDKTKARLVLKKGEKVVGDIDNNCVVGWWKGLD